MEVILLEKIPKLGELGDLVQVRAGYGRNYLIPQGKAKFATKENISEFEERRTELEATQKNTLESYQQIAEKLNKTTINISCKTSSEGRLFGSVNAIQIVEAVSMTGVELDKKQVHLPDGPFKKLGKFDVVIHLHHEIDATITLEIIAED